MGPVAFYQVICVLSSNVEMQNKKAFRSKPNRQLGTGGGGRGGSSSEQGWTDLGAARPRSLQNEQVWDRNRDTQTDMNESITFLQLRLWALKICRNQGTATQFWRCLNLTSYLFDSS